MTQDACLTLKTLGAALSTMRPACAKVSKNVHICKLMCVCVCVCLCVCLFIAADGGGKGEAFDFHCMNPIMPIFVVDVVERYQGRQSLSLKLYFIKINYHKYK